MPGFEACLHFQSSFLLACTLVGSRQWLRYLYPCRSRDWGLAWPSPSSQDNQQVRVSPLSLAVPPVPRCPSCPSLCLSLLFSVCVGGRGSMSVFVYQYAFTINKLLKWVIIFQKKNLCTKDTLSFHNGIHTMENTSSGLEAVQKIWFWVRTFILLFRLCFLKAGHFPEPYIHPESSVNLDSGDTLLVSYFTKIAGAETESMSAACECLCAEKGSGRTWAFKFQNQFTWCRSLRHTVLQTNQ